MAEIKKMSATSALIRFRGELGDVKLSHSKRIKLMEEFKVAFERSLDYDMASESALQRLLPELAGNEEEKSQFKQLWSDLNKGVVLPKQGNRVVHFSDLSTRDFLAIKEEIRDLVLNQEIDPEEVARDLADQYGISYNEIFTVAMHIGNPNMGVKTKNVRKGVLEQVFGVGSSSQSISQLRDYIDRELINGTPEGVIVNSLIRDAQKYFERDLSEKELDIILFNVKGEKVRLREQNKIA